MMHWVLLLLETCFRLSFIGSIYLSFSLFAVLLGNVDTVFIAPDIAVSVSISCSSIWTFFSFFRFAKLSNEGTFFFRIGCVIFLGNVGVAKTELEPLHSGLVTDVKYDCTLSSEIVLIQIMLYESFTNNNLKKLCYMSIK